MGLESNQGISFPALTGGATILSAACAACEMYGFVRSTRVKMVDSVRLGGFKVGDFARPGRAVRFIARRVSGGTRNDLYHGKAPVGATEKRVSHGTHIHIASLSLHLQHTWQKKSHPTGHACPHSRLYGWDCQKYWRSSHSNWWNRKPRALINYTPGCNCSIGGGWKDKVEFDGLGA